MRGYATRDTANTQPCRAHSQHAAHIPPQHNSIVARHTEAAVAAGINSRTGHMAKCAARLRGMNHVECRRRSGAGVFSTAVIRAAPEPPEPLPDRQVTDKSEKWERSLK